MHLRLTSAASRIADLLQRLRIDPFIVGILLMVAVAAVFPAHGAGTVVFSWATRVAVGLLFLLYGARLSQREALDGLRNWRLHLTVLLSTFALFPLLGLVAGLLAPGVLDNALYQGVLYLCLIPSTVQSSIAFTSIARGNVAAAICSASFSNLLGVMLTPLLVALLMARAADGVGVSAVLGVVLQLLVPFLAGQLLRRWVAGWVRRHSRVLKVVDRGSIMLVVYTAFSAGVVGGIWAQLSWRMFATLVLVCCVLLAVVLVATSLGSRCLGFARAERITIVFCGSKKSLASGLPMATVLFAGQNVGLIVLPLMLFHQIQLIVCAWLAQRAARTAPEIRHEPDDPTTRHAVPSAYPDVAG